MSVYRHHAFFCCNLAGQGRVRIVGGEIVERPRI